MSHAARLELSPDSIAARAEAQEAWRVPVEVALALPTSTLLMSFIRKRQEDQRLHRTAALFMRGDRLFVVLQFHPAGRPDLPPEQGKDLFYATDCFVQEPLV